MSRCAASWALMVRLRPGRSGWPSHILEVPRRRPASLVVVPPVVRCSGVADRSRTRARRVSPGWRSPMATRRRLIPVVARGPGLVGRPVRRSRPASPVGPMDGRSRVLRRCHVLAPFRPSMLPTIGCCVHCPCPTREWSIPENLLTTSRKESLREGGGRCRRGRSSARPGVGRQRFVLPGAVDPHSSFVAQIRRRFTTLPYFRPSQIFWLAAPPASRGLSNCAGIEEAGFTLMVTRSRHQISSTLFSGAS